MRLASARCYVTGALHEVFARVGIHVRPCHAKDATQIALPARTTRFLFCVSVGIKAPRRSPHFARLHLPVVPAKTPAGRAPDTTVPTVARPDRYSPTPNPTAPSARRLPKPAPASLPARGTGPAAARLSGADAKTTKASA